MGKQWQKPTEVIVTGKSPETIEPMNKPIIYHKVGMKVKRVKSKVERVRERNMRMEEGQKREQMLASETAATRVILRY